MDFSSVGGSGRAMERFRELAAAVGAEIEVDQGVAGQQRDIRPFRQRHVLAANVCGGRPARLTLGGSIKSLNKERS